MDSMGIQLRELLPISAESRPPEDVLTRLLALDDPVDVTALHGGARRVQLERRGPEVHLRGLIEMSNRCARDCLYCGIRRSNDGVERYLLSIDDIATTARWIGEQEFGSVVLQAGERTDAAFVDHVTAAIEAVREVAGPEVGITLSLGEQTDAVLRRWRDAGADRYLLRIETTRPDIYRALHPDHPDLDERIACLGRLRDGGWQVGTGVMIGLPGQTCDDLARDILFFRDHDVDMIGMGPFLPHGDTPMAHATVDPKEQLRLGLNMIAVTRLVLPDVNIASTTSLHALADDGRERGVLAGANVVMPNATDVRYRDGYLLYDGKPGTDETAESSLAAMVRRMESVGAVVSFGERGDSLRWQRRRG